MAQLTFPTAADGLWVDVRINLDRAALQSLQSTGQPMPNSIQAKGLIDTGSDISAVAASILQQLGVPVYGQARTQGIAGPVPVRVFKVALFILDLRQRHLPWLVEPDLVVMELPSATAAEVLIGLDILLGCKLIVDGPGGLFTLEF
jgi:hypothetical protein